MTTTEPNYKPKRTFEQTRLLAGHLGDKLSLIEEKLGYASYMSGQGKRLRSIADVMTIIGTTPNANINDAVLDAFNRHIDKAVESAKDWMKDFFTQDEEDQREVDDFPF